MSALQALIDQIYEAPFLPEKWDAVLNNLASSSGSASGTLMVFRDAAVIQHKTTDVARDYIEEFMNDGWQSSRRIQHYYARPCYGFVQAQQYFPEDVLRDASYAAMQTLGLESQLGAIIPMPGGELAAFAFNRWRDLGSHEAEAVDYLNHVHPHLARAAMIACRLGLSRAQTAVSTFEALGVPAAALTRTGRALASNKLLDSISDIVMPAAFGGLALASPAANKLFQQAIAHALTAPEGLVRSIPVQARTDQPALVVHVLPLFRAAADMLFGAEILVAVTCLKSSNFVPSPTVLMGLFDLTPSEARIAAALAAGKSLKEAAAGMGIGFGSARTYLAHIFSKTGTHQQSQLVALLKSAQPLAPPPKSS
ncbi:MAG: helix-turn-helix transcriptional regulator [Gallionellaceae bacterium]|jgi:DNA-binding CsgD family transcriptional regulator|nr:helix-turn-helix transcriptional regulator [Gallionellaceae bacterium]